MNESLCNEKHKYILKELNEHTKELKIHDEKISKLELEGNGHSKDIENLCKKIDDLVVTMNGITKTINDAINGVMKWVLITIGGATISGAIGLVYYFLRKGLEG